MKVKDILFYISVAIVVLVLVSGLGYLIGIPLYKQHQIEVQFPVGSPIALKDLDIKGNVSHYGDHGVDILIIDKAGKSQTITIEATLLTKP